MTKIKLENISYVYGAGTPYEIHALDNVNLEIKTGCVTGIIGHTGSGKSTLMQLLNGLERPTSGTVYLDGNDIWTNPKKIAQIRFKVGLVMQYPEYQLFEETVAKDIAGLCGAAGTDGSVGRKGCRSFGSSYGLRD